MGLEDINPNRGLIQKPLPRGGPLISMCKSVPGIFFDANGLQVDDEVAALAGFDVAALKAEKAKGEAMEKARLEIEAKFAAEQAKVNAMSDAELEEAGLVEPGALIPPKSEELEPRDEAPFITKTKSGEPRVARITPGGPVKVMEYDNQDKAWKVYERDSGKLIKAGLDKEDATALLLKP